MNGGRGQMAICEDALSHDAPTAGGRGHRVLSATIRRRTSVDLVGDLENVPEWVTHHGPSVSIGRLQRLLERDSIGIESVLIDGICIIHVDTASASSTST
jgi:hypothetical protein